MMQDIILAAEAPPQILLGEICSAPLDPLADEKGATSRLQ